MPRPAYFCATPTANRYVVLSVFIVSSKVKELGSDAEYFISQSHANRRTRTAVGRRMKDSIWKGREEHL